MLTNDLFLLAVASGIGASCRSGLGALAVNGFRLNKRAGCEQPDQREKDRKSYLGRHDSL
jgi:CRISPR/Cas system CMR-associated protein Cmr1 (group 7 of RAMP superfamily)